MEILELHLSTAMLRNQRTFYTEVLQLPLIGADPTSFTVQLGTTRLTFQSSPGAHPLYHFALNIPSNRVDDARAWLEGKATILPGRDGKEVVYFANWNAHAVYCLDPEGNIVEFIGRHTLGHRADEPFSPRQLESVSEIGLPVENVESFVTDLENALGLSLYSGDRQTFSAMGDERGLFIVVTYGRNWYPTTTPATSHPVTIVARTAATCGAEYSQGTYTIRMIPSMTTPPSQA